MKPCVFSGKVAPGVNVGNLVCATGAAAPGCQDRREVKTVEM